MTAIELFSRRAIDYVQPIEKDRATGLVSRVYAQAEREFELAPPLTVHSIAPDLLAALWAATRETLIVGPDRLVKEAIATGVSFRNACPFCVDVHAVMLASGDEHGVIDALRAGECSRISDPAIRAAVTFASGTLGPGEPTTNVPPFPRDRLAAYAGTAVVFHYLNRVVNVFMKESSPLALPSAIGWLRGPLSALAARTVGRSMVSVNAEPGASLVLLGSDVDIRSGVPWIDAHASIGRALSSLFAVAGRGLEEVVSAATQSTLRDAIRAWRGEDPPLGRAWLAAALDGVDAEDLAAARLALLSARAAYLVTEADVAAFRERGSDAALLRVVAWGAGAAAFQVARWIAPGDLS